MTQLPVKKFGPGSRAHLDTQLAKTFGLGAADVLRARREVGLLHAERCQRTKREYDTACAKCRREVGV